MVTEMITLKLDSGFLKEIDAIVKKENYQNRTEFIRESLRINVDKEKMKQTMKEIAKLKGAWKGKKTTPEEFEEMREKAFRQLEKKFKI
jgi:Arc/MetJ-type ribon-helix-helix transcriptional regulator